MLYLDTLRSAVARLCFSSLGSLTVTFLTWLVLARYPGAFGHAFVPGGCGGLSDTRLQTTSPTALVGGNVTYRSPVLATMP